MADPKTDTTGNRVVDETDRAGLQAKTDLETRGLDEASLNNIPPQPAIDDTKPVDDGKPAPKGK